MNVRKKLRAFLAVTIAFLLIQGIPLQAEAITGSNDRYYNNQTYLKQIRADKAWNVATGNQAITIAVLDSGVDTDHPDLKPNLLPGINLLNTARSAEDDFGHGTSVAGILAAKGNNAIGVAGVMWNAKILPIKVLDRRGVVEDVNVIAQGINTAVNRGAKIIVMSMSSLNTTRALEEAVSRAESRGVLLVAATGNEGSRVAYPAAYPTVIAVGAVNSSNQPLYSSNFGPEINLMAPGSNIYTTKMGGKYGTLTGTSAAAPQVAAAAALILSKYPKMSPLDVRQLLYQTATDLGDKGWDRKTGYGLLDVNKALRTAPSMDISEPNNSRSAAKAFPIESQVRAQLYGNDSVDWYYMDIPYDGKVTFNAYVSTSSIVSLAATFYPEDKQPFTYYIANGDSSAVTVKQGRMYIKLQRSGGVTGFSYVLTSRFTIGPDRYERNNSEATARPLVGNHIRLIGNYHEPKEQDWFSYYVRENGKLNLTVTTDTNRMDNVILIGKEKKGWDPKYDNGTRDDQTEKVSKEVTPGKYYIVLSEYWGNQVNGEYQFDLTYTPEREDVNEPNNTYRNASKPLNGTILTGTIPSRYDYDWFRFDVAADSYVIIRAPYMPVTSGVNLALYDSHMNFTLASENRVAELSDAGKDIVGIRLKPGRYYVRLNSTVPIKYDTYRLTITQQRLLAGYRDISSHWAKTEIVRLSQKGIIKGFADSAFRPDQTVTRAEFATMLIQSIRAKGFQISSYTGSSKFKDLTRRHWAYNNMMMAYRLGILKGYTNNTIQPNKPLTRAEMAAMVARAQSLMVVKRSSSSYRDVAPSHWASPAIEAITSRGWSKGYPGSLFKPNKYATRAEMVVLLSKAYKL